ncbi:hypothetical protein QE152_g30407 [Popillia japonica]|uniref:Uncharacterized protein n=1 Tax=Popillia japonica TaxID=7064 RepID=A0AAW1JEQ7_POPJA
MGFSRADKFEIVELIKDTLRKSLSDKVFIRDLVSALSEHITASIKEAKTTLNMESTIQEEIVHAYMVWYMVEDKDENIDESFKKLCVQKLRLDSTEISIDRIYRLGKKDNKKARDVIVKFTSFTVKANVLSTKKLLKGSGITISEDLTKIRYNFFKLARKKFGFRNV